MQVHGGRACALPKGPSLQAGEDSSAYAPAAGFCLGFRARKSSWRHCPSMILWLSTAAGHRFGKATVTYWNYRNGVSDCRGRRQQSTKAQLSYHSRSRASLRWSSLSCGKHLVLRSALSTVTPVLTMAGVDLKASTLKDL